MKTETGTLTFEILSTIEPKLQWLFEKAKNYSKTPNYKIGKYCPMFCWYRIFKPKLITLVGWEAVRQNELLNSAEAYDLCYRKIYEALPGCPVGCRECR